MARSKACVMYPSSMISTRSTKPKPWLPSWIWLRSPAFLRRQPDLVIRAASATGGVLHGTKAQFLAPWDCKNIIVKAHEVVPELGIILGRRGSWFGPNDLVVDVLSIGEMQQHSVPLTIDIAHAVRAHALTAARLAASAKARQL
ncbi:MULTISPECIES: hypothetical protein [unclassified Bradyrhizobium]|nr:MULTISPECIES: hypothetical protein [unclassified Bradyrhizobium]